MRVAIVNDQTIVVEALRWVLRSVPHYQLAWVARNGAEAVDYCAHDTPDLILMDLFMPVMDGVEATRRIMANTPCAILVVTATVEGHSTKVFEALRAGAIDVVGTPTITPEKRRGGAAMLLAKIDTVSRLVGGDAGREPARQSDRNNLRPGIVPPRCLVVIGASAGGPAALATILGGLSHDFPAAVVVIQHMDAQFAPLMVSWLNDQSPLSVRMARDGDQLQVGAALVASTNDHLVFVNAHTLGYTPEPRDAVYRPSIDVFCDSVIRHWRGKVVGILLTGMGRDGATGLKALRNTGAMTIAQDRTSCVVYGMPKAAAELDAAVAILPLDRIASDLNTLFP